MVRNEIIVPNSFAIQLISLGTSFTLPSNFCCVVVRASHDTFVDSCLHEEMKDIGVDFYTTGKRKREINASNFLEEIFICDADL